MEDKKSILHELYVFSEWKPEQEYLQKPDNIIPEKISAIWRWLKFFGPKKSLIDCVTAFKERHQKWHISLGDEGKVLAVLTDNILEIRTKRSDYATIAARTTVSRDPYAQWRRLAWSPDCSFVALAYGNGVVSFFDLTASSLFNIPANCLRGGGLECSDNTHAVAAILFMPLRVKHNKWNWEVLIVTFDGKLRGYLVTQSEFKLHHTFRFTEGVSAVSYSDTHTALYVCGVPNGKDPSSATSVGVTAWRIINEEPWYVLSVVSKEEAPDSIAKYLPFATSNLAFVVRMVLSPDHSKLVCLHCNGDVSVWRLPAMKLLYRWPLATQPQCDMKNPLVQDAVKDLVYHPADVNWWTCEEIILSRFSGAVSVCGIQDMMNVLGSKPEFFQGTPQVTCAHEGSFMVLECESTVLPARPTRSDDSMEVVELEPSTQDSFLDTGIELIKSVVYLLTDMEAFQPKPKKITLVSRVYRLLGVKSTNPQQLFNRKIESGHYAEALKLAATFDLDSDLVYQQQWRKNPVSTDAIHKYLSKVSNKIWVVHQCVDRLPETLSNARELLTFGLQLANDRILHEINKDLPEDEQKTVDDITLEDLNSSTSELLRCRHVMLFYKERLRLYEAILKSEKSTYVKDEYHRLRSNSLVHSAMEIAKEGRIDALTCLWPHITTVHMQLAVLEKIPETINPLDYQALLPHLPSSHDKALHNSKPAEYERDWCRKDIFRSIWSTNWSEDTTPEKEPLAEISENDPTLLTKWYESRAREIEERSNLVSNAMTILNIANLNCGIPGLEIILDHVTTLDVLVYDINIEGISLKQVENMTILETCKLFMENSTPETYVGDLKTYVVPFLKRYEDRTKTPGASLNGLIDFLESVSVDDLSTIFLVLSSPKELALDVRTHLELAERCILAHCGTDQLDMACDLLGTILKQTDGSISNSELIRRITELERLVSASSKISWRGVHVPPKELKDIHQDYKHAHYLLTRVARSLANGASKATQQDWEKLFADILDLQRTLFDCVTKEQCFEIYASALLTSGDAASIRLASEVLKCESMGQRQGQSNVNFVPYSRSVELVKNAATEYFNSASALTDPALELARSCLQIIKDDNKSVRQEIDLISALQLLSSFGLTILPVQVRLCEDKMTLIEDCLKTDQNAFLASHKLLKLATLLGIAGDDDQLREGLILQLVGEHAIRAGPPGYTTAADAARRLVLLRHAPAAHLMANVARDVKHIDNDARKQLYAAALTYCNSEELEDLITARLSVELESLEQMSGALREYHMSERDEEFADAVTTPVIEKKDLVAPFEAQTKVPLLSYLLDTIQSKLGSGDKPSETYQSDRSTHCQEFYSSLYPEHQVSNSYYGYDSFSLRGIQTEHSRRAQVALKWFYVQNSMDNGVNDDMEVEVVTKCGQELLYKDTPLSVSCLLLTTQNSTQSQRVLDAHRTDAAVCSTLYATLMHSNPQLKDDVYLTSPKKLAKTTLQEKNATEQQMEVIRQCLDKLTGMGEVELLKGAGVSVNGLLFNADDDYRRETIFRVARSQDKAHLELACNLATKHGLDALDVWIEHASNASSIAHLTRDTLPRTDLDAYTRIKDKLWPTIPGCDHNALISYFSLLKSIDDKPSIAGLTAHEHIKLLKKAKAASSELDYKLLLEQPSLDQFSSHILQITKPENVGLLTKFLRSLPPTFKVPMSVNDIYTAWLTKYFFSVPQSAASSKKWMQQYRQCASYFNKLSKQHLLQLVNNTCFTAEAVQRVPFGTRVLMIMQAVDYCQQEQENDFKLNKNEQSWAQVGQELSRWARFLENFHSTTIQAIVDSSQLPRDQIWTEIETSHGDTDALVSCCAQLVLLNLKPSALTTLLQCLNVDATPLTVLQYMADYSIDCLKTMEKAISRLTQFHKEGVTIPQELIDAIMQKAEAFNLPPQLQITLVSLGDRSQLQDSDDMMKIAKYTLELFRAEWQNDEIIEDITEENLMSEEGRSEAFSKLLSVADSWLRKVALADALLCWPPQHKGEKSLFFEYLLHTLNSKDQKEALALIKLLLRRPVLSEEEVNQLAENAPSEAVTNAIWIILLNKHEHSDQTIVKLVNKHKESFANQDIEVELVSLILDSNMFIKLVSTPIYASLVNYIINQDSTEKTLQYSVSWATNELIKANFLAEAGHLHLLAIGVPSPLRGFSQCVAYVKNVLMK